MGRVSKTKLSSKAKSKKGKRNRIDARKKKKQKKSEQRTAEEEEDIELSCDDVDFVEEEIQSGRLNFITKLSE